MTNKGRVVREVPPRAGHNLQRIDWDGAAVLAKLAGAPVLAAEHVRDSRVKSVRQYTRPPFVTDEGKIIIEMRNSKVEDGVRYGDVYFRWEPTTTKKEG